MEDDSNTGKNVLKIGSSSQENPLTTSSSGLAGQENAPTQSAINVDEAMRVDVSSSDTGRAELNAWLPPLALPRGYGKGKRKIDAVYRTCSTDFNPSSHTRRRLLDGSILEVERRPPPPPGRLLTLSELRSLADVMPLGGSPGVVSIQPPTTIGMSDPPSVWPAFPRLDLPAPRGPVPMPTIYEDSDQDADTLTPPTSSSNDEMIDADSSTMPESHRVI